MLRASILSLLSCLLSFAHAYPETRIYTDTDLSHSFRDDKRSEGQRLQAVSDLIKMSCLRMPRLSPAQYPRECALNQPYTGWSCHSPTLGTMVETTEPTKTY
jgi:hypothetical protein